MLVEYSLSKHFPYEDYITRGDLAGLIDIHISKTIRDAIGGIADVYYKSGNILVGIVEYVGYVSHADRHMEIISIDVSDRFNSVDIVGANLVDLFHQIFARPDEIDTEVQGSATEEPGSVGNQHNVHVEIAKDLVRRRMFPEALRTLDHATFGEGGTFVLNRGRDWLRAVICLGISGRPESVATLDLAKSEKSFLQASQQAPPRAAAQCLIGAAKAAYIQGRLADAESHLRSALAIEPSGAEANYQLARLLLHAGDLKAVEILLGRVFDRHWSFAMRAASDALFVVNAEIVARIAHATASKAILTEIRPKLNRLSSQMNLLKKNQLPQFPVNTNQSFNELALSIDSLARELEGNHLKAAYQAKGKIYSLEKEFIKSCEVYCVALIGMETKLVEDQIEAIKGDGVARIQEQPAVHTVAFGMVGMALIAAYFAPELRGGAGSAAIELDDVIGFLSKTVFVAFIIGVYAIPIFWFSARSFAKRKSRRREAMIEMRKQRMAATLRSEIANVVSAVEEMAGLRADRSARSLQPAELPHQFADGPTLDRVVEIIHTGTSSPAAKVR